MRKLVIGLILLALPAYLAATELVIVADISESLKTNDPQDLRKDALRLFLAEAQNNTQLSQSNISIYTFGEKSALLAKGTPAELGQINQHISELPREDQFTDLKAVLERVFLDFSSQDRGTKYLLLFTDGELDADDLPLGTNLVAYLSELNQRATQLAGLGFEIYSLAFTKKANFDILRDLASITRGNVVRAVAPADASQKIMELISTLVAGPYPANIEKDIFIDDSIGAFSVIATKGNVDDPEPQITLKDPSGKTVDVSSLKDSQRSYTRVNIEDPQVGSWQVLVTGASGVQFYTHKKTKYDFIVHKPESGDLTVSAGSPVDFDIEITGAEQLPPDFFKNSRIVVQGPAGFRHEYPVRIDRNRIYATVDGLEKQGRYQIQLQLITNNKDQINRDFHLEVKAGVDFRVESRADCVLGRHWLVSAYRPSGVESRFKGFSLEIRTPEGKIDRLELFDDGSKEHGDELAGDSKFSNYTKPYETEGSYINKVRLILEELGRRMESIKSFEIQKLLRIGEPQAAFPRSAPWSVEVPLKIANLSNLMLTFNDPIQTQDERVTVDFPRPLIIQAKDSSVILLRLASGGGISEDRLNIRATTRCAFQIDGKTISPDVAFDLAIEKRRSLAELAGLIIAGLLGLVFLCIVIGMLVVTPLRFRDKLLVDNAEGRRTQVPLGSFRRVFASKVSIGRDFKIPPGNITIAWIGLRLFGYGRWALCSTGKTTDPAIKLTGWAAITRSAGNPLGGHRISFQDGGR